MLLLLPLSGCLDPQAPAPVTFYGRSDGAGSAGVHTVSRGETIYTISRRYDLVMQDIVAVNHLVAPFALHAGQRIKLPPPQTYRARAGDTVYSISRLFGVSSTDVVRLNHWQAPYRVSAGQSVKLPSVGAGSGSFVERTVSALVGRRDGDRHSKDPAFPFPKGPQQDGTGKTDGALAGTLGTLRIARHTPPQGQAHILRLPEGYALPSETAPILPEKKPPLAAQGLRETQDIARAESVPVAPRVKISSQTPQRASSRFLRPVAGKVISAYGSKPDGLHNDGINIKAPKGTTVKAAENGVVVYAGNELKGTGNLILIRHDGRWMTAYAHLDQITIKRGDVIKRGQTIGTVGSTGSVDSPQLHFEVRRGTEAINPVRYLES